MTNTREYNDINDVPKIPFGTYQFDLDINGYDKESNQLLSSDKVKYTGANGVNLFCKTPIETKQTLTAYLNNAIGIDFDWNFEYFKSSEPAGLHTDYTSFENSWKPKEMNVITHDCHLIIGVIIPLDWNCKQPYTINYDRISTVPRKLIYRKGEMRYVDNDDVVDYRTSWEYDVDVLNYNPEGTEYYREYADLKIHSVYEWQKGTMMVFDTARWHSSSWFLSTNKVIKPAVEFKKSIIGFGSIDVIREEFR
jgi:hypothetical protein